MHGLGEAVPSDFYVLRLILIELEVDRVSKDIVGEGPSESTDTSDCSVAHTKRDAVYTEHDFNREKLHALSLLDLMFGGLRGALGWDVDTPELPHSADISLLSKRSSRSPTLFLLSRMHKGIRGVRSRPLAHLLERALASMTTQNADTKAKLRDLFVPQEEQGDLPLEKYL